MKHILLIVIKEAGMPKCATVRMQSGCAGRVKGRVVRPAAKAEGEGQAPSTGKVTFKDDVGNVRTCSYVLDQVRPWTDARGTVMSVCCGVLHWTRSSGPPTHILTATSQNSSEHR